MCTWKKSRIKCNFKLRQFSLLGRVEKKFTIKQLLDDYLSSSKALIQDKLQLIIEIFFSNCGTVSVLIRFFMFTGKDSNKERETKLKKKTVAWQRTRVHETLMSKSECQLDSGCIVFDSCFKSKWIKSLFYIDCLGYEHFAQCQLL